MELKWASLLQAVGFFIIVIFLGLLKNEVLMDIIDALKSRLKNLVKTVAYIFLNIHKRSDISKGHPIRTDLYLFFIAPILVLILSALILPVRLLRFLSALFAPHDTTIKVWLIFGIILTFTGLIMELIAYW